MNRSPQKKRAAWQLRVGLAVGNESESTRPHGPARVASPAPVPSAMQSSVKPCACGGLDGIVHGFEQLIGPAARGPYAQAAAMAIALTIDVLVLRTIEDADEPLARETVDRIDRMFAAMQGKKSETTKVLLVIHAVRRHALALREGKNGEEDPREPLFALIGLTWPSIYDRISRRTFTATAEEWSKTAVKGTGRRWPTMLDLLIEAGLRPEHLRMPSRPSAEEYAKVRRMRKTAVTALKKLWELHAEGPGVQVEGTRTEDLRRTD